MHILVVLPIPYIMPSKALFNYLKEDSIKRDMNESRIYAFIVAIFFTVECNHMYEDVISHSKDSNHTF